MPMYDYKCPVCQARREVILKLVEVDTAIVHCAHCGNAMNKQLSAPRVFPDYPAYDCPITGKRIEGRRAHIENLAQHGCRVYEPGETEEFKRKQRQDEEQLDRAIETTVEREIHQMPSEKRERLASELEHGLAPEIVRTSPTH